MIEKFVSGPVQDRDGWLTSSFSNPSGSCVEVRFAGDAVLIRDSKDRQEVRPIIGVSSVGWGSFIDTVR